MLRKIILIVCITFSFSLVAQVNNPLFDNKSAEDILAKAQKLLAQKGVTIQSLAVSRDELEAQIDKAQDCIEWQKSHYKKLDSTLKIIGISALESTQLAQTADLAYLKEKQQIVRQRLGTCSLYQLKSKDVLEQLDTEIITQTKRHTWKKSDELLVSVQSPLEAFDDFSFTFKSDSFVLGALIKYLGAFITGMIFLIAFFRHRQVQEFVKQLQLKTSFLLGGFSLALILITIDCFVSQQVIMQFKTNSSYLFFQWVYLGFFYWLTFVYCVWFLKAHKTLKLKKAGLLFLFMLFLSFSVTFCIALYGYPYLAYYISMGILQTLALCMVSLILIVLCSKFSNYLANILGQKQTLDGVELAKTEKTEIDFKVLDFSLKASIIVYWLTLCINIWQLSLSADRVLLKWVYNGFSFLNIHLVPVDFVKAGLVFAITAIVIRLIAKMLFKVISPVVLNFGYLIAGLSALYAAGVNLTGIAVVAGALSVGIGMGLKGIVNNFISGLIMLIEKPIKRGDRIIVNDVEGYVKSIGLRATEIQTPTNTDVIVPNEQFITSTVTNYMLNETSSISSIDVGIAYGSDVELAQEILQKIAKAHPHIVSNKTTSPWVCLKSFADSAIVLQLIYTVQHAKFLFRTKGELNSAIYQEFNKHKIEFPFPQSDIYIKEFPNMNVNESKKDKE